MDDHHFRWSRWFSGTVLSGFDLTVRATGQEQVQELAPGAVVVVNGGSFLELMGVWAAFPQPVRFVLPPECFRMILFGRLLRRMGNIPLLPGRDGRGLVRQARGLFRHGGHIGVFWPDPESGLASPALQLAARVAWRARCPVIPVALFGAREILPPGNRVPHTGTLRLRMGLPQRWSIEGSGRPGAEIRRLAEAIRAAVLGLTDPLLDPPPELVPPIPALPPFPPAISGGGPEPSQAHDPSSDEKKIPAEAWKNNRSILPGRPAPKMEPTCPA